MNDVFPTFPWHDLLSWYKQNGRHNLPWRDYTCEEDNRAYRVWLSEIFLQQTQVERVRGYFTRIIEKYPTVHHLAEASYEEFFPYYQGMGYYSRARNLLKTATIISKDFSGKFPREKSLLQKLPGVGGYTSSAILAFAFGEPYLAWDTNLEKVFSRYLHGTKFQKLTNEEKEMVEEDFRKYVSERGGEQKNGETEGGKLSEPDESQKNDEQSERVFSPLGTFGTFSHESTENTSLASSSSPGMANGEWRMANTRAINNALMDFAATVDLKNPDAIDWEKYPIRSGLWYETRGALEPREVKKSISFPLPDASVVVILHKDHRIYYGPPLTPQSPLLQRGEAALEAPSPLGEGRGEVYLPFLLPSSLTRDTRKYVQDYFRECYGLELSVRPPHKKWISEDGKPYVVVNAQIQSGDPLQFETFTKKDAQEILQEIIPQ